MTDFTDKQVRALSLTAVVSTPMTLASMPKMVGIETIAALAARGLLNVQITISAEGRQALLHHRSAEMIRLQREQMKSRLRKLEPIELMGAR